MSTDLYQGWDHRWLGNATLDWTDSSGSYSVSTTSADRFCHISLAAVNIDSREAATINTGFSSFAAWLKTAMDGSASARTFTVTWDATDLTYTITPNSGTLALTFIGTAGARMRRILGFTANKTAAASQESDMRPWYVMRAQVDGRSKYDFPTAREGQIKSSTGDDASMYTLAPTRLIHAAKWEHAYEPPEAVHRRHAVSDTTVGGASWTWQDWMDHAARYAVPCAIKDSRETMVFRTRTPFERGMARRRKPEADPQQTVAISADAIIGYL
jgi:hypothetical protein